MHQMTMCQMKVVTHSDEATDRQIFPAGVGKDQNRTKRRVNFALIVHSPCNIIFTKSISQN